MTLIIGDITGCGTGDDGVGGGASAIFQVIHRTLIEKLNFPVVHHCNKVLYYGRTVLCNLLYYKPQNALL